MHNKILERKIFWSPSVRWQYENDKLKIEKYIYANIFFTLFPDFYFLTQRGIFESNLTAHFDFFNKKLLKMFINDLLNKKLLVNTILSPQELFFTQNRLFEHNYGKTLIIDAAQQAAFKKQQLNRDYFPDCQNAVSLESGKTYCEYLVGRKSVRKFDADSKISFSDFSFLAGTYGQLYENGEIRYLYASAGGLYPVDIYYCIKDGRVENIESGIYYYDPVRNRLVSISPKRAVPKEAHYFTNQDIFADSAFSIFYFYNAEVSMPKYGGLGYYYAMIDTGIMVATYNLNAESRHIGVCSIGDMNFDCIRELFKLKSNQIYLHTLEVGLKE
jgi:SagB-type dehydrogenase family enzyme